MEKIKNEIWENLLGYKPDREVKEMILAEVAATGKPLQQVIGEGKTIPIMSETGILGPDGLFEYRGRRITGAQWEKENPLGSFGKIVIIGTKERVALHRKLSPNANYKTK